MVNYDQKCTCKIYISVANSSSPECIYLRALHRIQGKKDVMSSKSGPCLLQKTILIHDLLHNFHSSNSGQFVLVATWNCVISHLSFTVTKVFVFSLDQDVTCYLHDIVTQVHCQVISCVIHGG
jgi:hypothetical protein